MRVGGGGRRKTHSNACEVRIHHISYYNAAVMPHGVSFILDINAHHRWCSEHCVGRSWQSLFADIFMWNAPELDSDSVILVVRTE